MNEKTETRTCKGCDKPFEYEPLFFNGREIFTETCLCDPCLDEKRALEAHSKRVSASQAEFGRVVPKGYRNTDLSDPRFNKRLWEKLKGWNMELGWLGLVGQTGKCKTRCLAMIVKKLVWNGHRVEWCTATKFQWAVQNQWSDEDGYKAKDLLKRWAKVEVLVLDDLGKQKWTDSVEAEFFAMLEHRTSHELMTLWSANTHPEEMIRGQQLSKDRGAPIVGRLLDYSEIILV